MADAKAIRRYQAGIERALALFDATNEWADYIAFLSRLSKAIQGPPPQAEIPLKATIARQLAQCLRQSLPSGVHQKALEVYDLIFSTIGLEGLTTDLSLYLPGLSHTLSFASLSTRPQFLAIYDDHILALPANVLRPALRALIIALLPGIEEETSEDFERTLSTFNRLRQKLANDHHEEIFWQNLFLASITSPNRRSGVLVYLARYLPKLAPQPSNLGNDDSVPDVTRDMQAVTTPEPGLLVRCFATGLQDPQPLVQRGFLDLLVLHLPLNAFIFTGNSHVSDLDVLVNASAAVVLRRDMSLNRRLWAWFTGSDNSSPASSTGADTTGPPISPSTQRNHIPNTQYFATFGLQSLIRSIFAMLDGAAQEPASRARPFRIALSLMDRWEIGGPVVKSLFVPLLKNLQLYQATAPSQDAFDEVFRSANVFFDGIESTLIVTQLLSLLHDDDLDLVIFIVNNFNLDEDDMARNHIPCICLFIVERLRQLMRDEPRDEMISISEKLSTLLEELLILVPAGAFQSSHGNETTSMDWQAQITKHYAEPESQRPTETESITPGMVVSALLRGVFECLQEVAVDGVGTRELVESIFNSMNQCVALANAFDDLKRVHFLQRLITCVQSASLRFSDLQYQVTIGTVRLMTTLHSKDPLQEILRSEDLCALVPPTIQVLWQYLHPSTPQYHVEAVESIWHLHTISRPLHLAESTITSLLAQNIPSIDLEEETIQRFSTLWVHSRTASKQTQAADQRQRMAHSDEVLDLLENPLLFIIDATDETDTSDACAQWILSLNTLNTLFGVVIARVPVDMTDAQSTSMGLQRFKKLTSLAKQNEAQWKSFRSKSGQRDVILELCLSLTSKEAEANTLGVEALHLLRLMSGDGADIDEDTLKALSTRLTASKQLRGFQDALLDTLQTAFSSTTLSSLPDFMVPILLDGISSVAADVTLDKWITLLCTIVPLLGSSTLLSNLIRITSCLCDRIESYFSKIQDIYKSKEKTSMNGVQLSGSIAAYPERSISNLLAGMEYVLARAHHQASLSKSEQATNPKSPVPELPSSRSSANDRLTVVLCMQDALKICSRLWLWRSVGRPAASIIDPKSFQHLSARLRTRSRRILENLVEAEPQECLETLIGMWVEKRQLGSQHSQVLELLQTLDGARPKFMMPATFNAIYNRTNPGALDKSQKSSLSVNVSAFEILAFLNDYTSALEDDLLDEIWTDCTTFLREVLANPMPHRQILLKLLEFAAVLCRKMENTNFGEESRMRKELADLSTRLFTAIFTVKPAGLDGSGSKPADADLVFNRRLFSSTRSSVHPSNALQILQDSLPDLAYVLTQSDRLVTVYNGIAANITGPLLHSKLYPHNVSPELLALLQAMSTAPAAVKAWRKDLSDAFNDPKFFQNPASLVEPGWVPLLRQLAAADKALMPELLARITPPAAAGIMFGVGATAARADADKKVQLTVRRVAVLLLSMDPDAFLPHLQLLLTKMEELLTATPESSPSSASRADVYLLLRTVVLAFTQSQLSAFWPLVDNELRELCVGMAARETTTGKFNAAARLQGAKLLDLLLLLKPDEFQVHEWTFVTDTVDAIYPPHDLPSVALVDQIVHTPLTGHPDVQSSGSGPLKRPWLCTDDTRDGTKAESLLAGFFAQLSIRTFEDSYSLKQVDLKACREDIIQDLFTAEGAAEPAG